ncbi:hypothetical protein [Paenibacillus odorifer]|uniref:hypothetical protein n=1 Tax=Paenibacillus TaxID=44249 RepID=UPI00096E5CF1|nr:hypothetical protein [Paenibacillus odorifer]OMC97766.1 hypothetical protein BJP46_25065 [Paenibacillus odorifer]
MKRRDNVNTSDIVGGIINTEDIVRVADTERMIKRYSGVEDNAMSDVIIIVTQTKEQSLELRKIIPQPNVMITWYGANVCGFCYLGRRPKLAICAYKERDGYGWTNEVLRAGIAHGAQVITL